MCSKKSVYICFYITTFICCIANSNFLSSWLSDINAWQQIGGNIFWKNYEKIAKSIFFSIKDVKICIKDYFKL